MGIEQKQNQFNIKSGKDVARYAIYFSRNQRQNGSISVNIANISGIGVYKKHKAVCDRCFEIQQKYGIDLVKYLNFFLSRYKLTDENMEKIADASNFMWYAEDLQISVKREKVYGYVLKSVNNIVNDCIEQDFISVKEYLKHLIEKNKLAEKYLSGKISRYYLAGIKNLRKLVAKMDVINQDTLREIVDQQEQLLSDVQDAFMQMKNARVSIIDLTSECLSKTKQKKNNNNKL